MKDDPMEPIEASKGRFTARETGDGAPSAFVVDKRSLTVVRGAARQEIVHEHGLGGVALCALDGRVLGYGTLAIEDLPPFVSDLDGGSEPSSTPLTRLAELGYGLVLPLDAMPPEVRDRFLAARVDPGLVDAARMTDEAIAEAAGHYGHDHDHTDDCAVCGVREVNDQIDRLVGSVGHAVIVTPESDGQASYTVGLAEAGWPELAMSGIPSRAIQIVNAVVETLRAGERRPSAGMTIAKAMSVELKLRAVESGRIGGAARMRAQSKGGADPEFLQILWPDADGYYPDEPEYDDVNLPQRLL